MLAAIAAIPFPCGHVASLVPGRCAQGTVRGRTARTACLARHSLAYHAAVVLVVVAAHPIPLFYDYSFVCFTERLCFTNRTLAPVNQRYKARPSTTYYAPTGSASYMQAKMKQLGLRIAAPSGGRGLVQALVWTFACQRESMLQRGYHSAVTLLKMLISKKSYCMTRLRCTGNPDPASWLPAGDSLRPGVAARVWKSVTSANGRGE